MKYKLIIDDKQEESIVITAHSKTDLIKEIEALIAKDSLKLYGYKDEQIVPLDKNEVYAFYTLDGKVYASVKDDILLIKERIYQLEESFSETFIKVNQGCLINIKKIAKFETNLGGSIKVVMKNGYSDYISRRELQNVKRRMGL